jgi:hypothetical protein
MTQYPAAIPKAKAPAIVNRNSVVSRNVVISILRHARGSFSLMLPLYLALTLSGVDN